MEHRFISYERSVRIKSIKDTYGRKREWKKSLKLCDSLFKAGKITNEDFEELAYEGFLGPNLREQITILKKQRLCKLEEMLRPLMKK
jgi:hypothetical protein